ncbi:MAG TPA: hypothetical protein VF164_00860 [Trueperaceae bacterium]
MSITQSSNPRRIAREAVAQRRPTALRLAFAAAVATALLTACSSLIPDQNVTDPLGLDGQSVAIAFPGGETVVAMAVTGSGSADFTFPDLEIPDLPLSPAELTNEVSIASASLNAGAGEAPDQITLSGATLTVRVWHGAATFDDADDKADFVLNAQGAVTLTRGGCTVDSCAYTYTGVLPAFGVASLTGAELASAMQVATEAPTPNDGHVSLSVAGEPEADLAGRTLTITLDGESGTIGF